MALIASLAALGAASPALAACHKNQHEYGTVCETEKEHSEFQAFANCPFKAPIFREGFDETQACIWGQSSYREKFRSKAEAETYHETHPELHAEFHAGNMTVALKLPITLKGGFQEDRETGEQQWIGAEGAETVTRVAQKAQPLKDDVDIEKLSPSERERYTFAVLHKETNVTATIELAGPPTSVYLNEENLLEGKGEALGLPTKVKLSNPFLGNSCYVASDAKPIQIELTTGESGALHGKTGSLFGGNHGGIVTISNDTLVNSTYEAPGVEGCGEGGGADEAVNAALGLPSPTGNTAIIDGSLKQAGAETAKEGLEGKL